MNVKNTTRHHGRKSTPLVYWVRSLQEQFCGTQFLISFLKLFREMNSFIFTGAISQFLGFNVGFGDFQNHETLCSQKVSYHPIIFIFSEILLLRYLCENISYSFTRLAMFYLKHLCSKTLDDSIMSSSKDDSLSFWISWRHLVNA